MNPLTMTTLLSYLLLACALAVLALSLPLLVRPGARGTGALYLGVSLLTAGALVPVLLRLARGIVCYRPPLLTLLIYGVLIALHLSFFRDAARLLRRGSARRD